MKKFSEVIDYYYSELNPIVKELEKKRQKVKKNIITWMIGGVVAIFILITAVMSHTDVDIFLQSGIVLLGASVGLYGFLYKMMSKGYNIEFKLRVIEPLIKFIDPNLKYTPNATIPEYIFKKSKIITDDIDLYHGDDLVEGVVDGVNIAFCDLHVEKEYKDSNNDSDYQTLFQGIFLQAEFPKEFHGTTVVLPDMAENIFGSYLGRMLQSFGNEMQLVKLDNVEFEKYFVVYSSDQIEARYILSHSMMERMIKFRKKVGHRISFSFVGGEMFVGVHYNRESLEASVFGSLLEYKIVKEFVESLYYSLEIVQELKLNQKIWSKR
ncbi:MAG: DUF3137 domain-containing protein [Epsilonproteobacteria bacterium]|nr:DUF3137 domain-containing protein [Campylobacterota bacterium]